MPHSFHLEQKTKEDAIPVNKICLALVQVLTMVLECAMLSGVLSLVGGERMYSVISCHHGLAWLRKGQIIERPLTGQIIEHPLRQATTWKQCYVAVLQVAKTAHWQFLHETYRHISTKECT